MTRLFMCLSLLMIVITCVNSNEEKEDVNGNMEGLPPAIQPFTQCVIEKNVVEMKVYVRELMGGEYTQYQELINVITE